LEIRLVKVGIWLTKQGPAQFTAVLVGFDLSASFGGSLHTLMVIY
jgi:hypothetical protein